ncbi:MAG TPA: S9 family peptidase [Steroidobacteraceae bacterium]
MKRSVLFGCLLVAASAFSQTSTQAPTQPPNPASNQAPTPATVQLPVEVFTRYDELGYLQLSPNGDFVALSMGKAGQYSLVVIDLKARKVIGGLRMPNRLSIEEFYWVSNQRLIFMTSERQGGKRYSSFTGEIFAVDRDGSKQRRLYGMWAGEVQTGTRVRVRGASYADPQVLSTLRGDERHILIAEYPWREAGGYLMSDADAMPTYSRLDVDTGMKDKLGRAPLARAQLLVDNHDQVRFAVGRNAQQHLAVIWKSVPDALWATFELPGFDSETITPRRFSTDDRSVYFTGTRSAGSFVGLYRLNLETQAVEEIGAFEDMDVGSLIMDFADREIIGIRGASDKSVFKWLVPNDPTARLYESLLRAFDGKSVSIASATDDGHLVMAFVRSSDDPGAYYLFDTQKKSAGFFRASRDWIDSRQMRSKEPIEVTARDGLVLHGYLTRPAGEGEHPLVVMPHGGPHGIRDDSSFDGEVQLLANRGYAVLQINFRGSGGYGRKFEEAGYRHWGESMQDDITDATHWAIDQKVAPADRICIMGASYGGYAALMGVVREPKLYRCAVGLAGIYDLELMLTSADIPDSKGGRAYLEEVLGSDKELLRSRSPVYNAQVIEANVMLIHGKADWRAAFEQATRMKAALDKYHKPVEWIALDGEGHGIFDEDSRREVYGRVVEFLDRNLMQKGEAAAH